MRETFTARVVSGHKVTVPKECRERLDLKPRQLCRITLANEEGWQNMHFLAKIQVSGQFVIPVEVYEENELKKRQLVTVTIHIL